MQNRIENLNEITSTLANKIINIEKNEFNSKLQYNLIY